MWGVRAPSAFRTAATVVAVFVTVSATLSVGPAGLSGRAATGQDAASLWESARGLLDAITPPALSASHPDSPTIPTVDGGLRPGAPDSGGHSNVTTLQLANGTLTNGAAIPGQVPQPASVTYDPVLNRLYVANARPEEGPGDLVAVVSPATDSVVGVLNDSVCPPSEFDPDILFDPHDGLLIQECGDQILAGIDPSTGEIATATLLPGLSVGPICSGFIPQPAALAVDPAGGRIFALLYGCSSTNASAETVLTLDVVNDSSWAVVATANLSTTLGIGSLLGHEALAFDPSSGDLYVSDGPTFTESSFYENVDVIDPATGAVVTVLKPNVEVEASPPIAYVPGLKAVVLGGVREVTVGQEAKLVATLYRLNASSGAVVPLLNWTAQTHTSLGAPGPVDTPTWISAYPGTGPEVAVSMSLDNATSGAVAYRTLVYNLTDRAELANVSTVQLGASTIDTENGVLYSVAGAAASLEGIGGTPPHVVASIAVGTFPLASTIDPATGTVYQVVGTECGPTTAVLGSGIFGCPNETVVEFHLPSEDELPGWTLVPGVALSMIFDPIDQEIYVVSACGTWNGASEIGCGSPPGDARITAYSPDGTLISSVALPLTLGGGELGDFGLAVDPAIPAVLILAGTARGAELLAVDPASLAVLGTAAPWSDTEPGGSLAYDAADGAVFAEIGTWSTDPLVFHDVVFELNAATLASEAATTLPGPIRFGDSLLADNPSNDTVYATNGTELFVLNGPNDSLLGSFAAGGAYTGLAYLPTSGILYVTTSVGLVEVNDRGVFVGIDRTGTLQAGPTDLTVDPVSGTAVVAQSYAGSVSFVRGPGSPRYRVDFPETGLPNGTPWSVTLNGSTESASGPLDFGLPNGSYSYSVSPVPGYLRSGPDPTGTVVVDGANVSETGSVFSLATYSLSVTITGATPPAGWNVSIAQVAGPAFAGPCPTCVNTSSERRWLVPNGTYRYVVRSLSPGFVVEGGPASDLVVVAGAPVALAFTFVAGATHSVSFHESGLADGTSWCASLNPPLSTCSDARTISFPDLTPGEYPYAISPPVGYSGHALSGSLDLGRSSLTLNRTFALTKYDVTLGETGLKPHVAWKVVIDGKTYRTVGPARTIRLPNGTYTYSTEPIPGYLGARSGTFVVAGSPRPLYFDFPAARFTVTFQETGLPVGQEWWVEVGNETIYSSNASIPFSEPNGTYRYHVSAGEFGFRHSDNPWPVRVRGGAVTVDVAYRPVHGAASPGPVSEAPSLGAVIRSGRTSS